MPRHRLRARAVALAGLTLLAGCTDLKAVNTSAGQLVSAAGSWDAVGAGFAASCQRRDLVSQVPSACVEEAEASKAIAAADKLLLAYFKTLQQASDKSKYSLSGGVSAIGDSAKKLPHANSSEIGAITGLASFLADAATSAMRERTLRRLLDLGGPKAEAALTALATYVPRELGQILDREQNETRLTYDFYLQQAGLSVRLKDVDCARGAMTKTFPTGNGFMLGVAYCQRIAVIDQQRAALGAYARSLATAKSTLQALRGAKGRLGARALIEQLISQGATLNADIAALNKAF